MFFSAPDMVQHVRQRLKVAERDDRIKAVILRVDSPGGTVTASDEIYEAIRDRRPEAASDAMYRHVCEVETGLKRITAREETGAPKPRADAR